MRINQDKVKTIYKNQIGISFFWGIKGLEVAQNKVNLVFNSIALQYDIVELNLFHQDIENSLAKPLKCDCETPRDCKSILLETPLEQLNLAMSYNELLQMKDLLEGTLFHLNLKNMLNEII